MKAYTMLVLWLVLCIPVIECRRQAHHGQGMFKVRSRLCWGGRCWWCWMLRRWCLRGNWWVCWVYVRYCTYWWWPWGGWYFRGRFSKSRSKSGPNGAIPKSVAGKLGKVVG